MKRPIRRLCRLDDGVTLVELMVAVLIMSFIGVALVTGMMAAMRSADLHRDDDRAVQDLRHAKDNLTREVRSAAELTVASENSLTIWLDADADGSVDAGETVTWTVTAGGSLTRSTDTTDAVALVVGLVAGESSFAYDAADVGEIRRVTVTLTSEVGATDGTRSLRTDVFLRNAP